MTVKPASKNPPISPEQKPDNLSDSMEKALGRLTSAKAAHALRNNLNGDLYETVARGPESPNVITKDEFIRPAAEGGFGMDSSIWSLLTDKSQLSVKQFLTAAEALAGKPEGPSRGKHPARVTIPTLYDLAYKVVRAAAATGVAEGNQRAISLDNKNPRYGFDLFDRAVEDGVVTLQELEGLGIPEETVQALTSSLSDEQWNDGLHYLELTAVLENIEARQETPKKKNLEKRGR
ncbi:MAG: hypothetical protein IT573_10210 [Deltaproteobacteria bacterium]|nr:hypothetical protein [Deltaproteobacteria bacterium]